MSAQRVYRFSAAEYLQLEDAAETKSEYFNGEIFAMAGASPAHNTITVNLSREFSAQLKGMPCRTFAGEMRVRIRDFGIDKYSYPDLAVVCGDREFEGSTPETLLNPSLIVEVLSSSTEAYDRGAKFAHYRRIASLREYILISQSAAFVEHYGRQEDDRWLLTEYCGFDAIVSISSADVALKLSEVYYNVDFDQNNDSLAVPDNG